MTTELLEKAKRGRPPVMDTEHFLSYQKLWNHLVETRRGLLNKHYEIKGFGIIRKMQKDGITGLEYISDPVKEKFKAAILTELGHWDEESIRIIAPAICEAQKQPETKRTVHELCDYWREYRLHPERLSETVSENKEAIA